VGEQCIIPKLVLLARERHAIPANVDNPSQDATIDLLLLGLPLYMSNLTVVTGFDFRQSGLNETGHILKQLRTEKEPGNNFLY
jgi:hypothetical protein